MICIIHNLDQLVLKSNSQSVCPRDLIWNRSRGYIANKAMMRLRQGGIGPRPLVIVGPLNKIFPAAHEANLEYQT
jgi:hypothetical protein